MSDIAVTAANLFPGANANLLRGVAAAAIAAGQTVYRLTDGTIGLADANGTTPADVTAGIAVCSALRAGQPITYTDDDDDLTLGGTTVAGEPYMQSATPGGICPPADLVTGWKGTLIGFGKTGNKLRVKIIASGQTVP